MKPIALISGLFGCAIAPTAVFLLVAFNGEVRHPSGEPLTRQEKIAFSILTGALFGFGSATGGVVVFNAVSSLVEDQ